MPDETKTKPETKTEPKTKAKTETKTGSSRQDFVSKQRVKWCPGCGGYSILVQIQKVLAAQGIPHEKFVFVSGIGCSSRFPYYMNTYGFHSIHGRAPAIATGIKIANPELSVWVATGDGDALSIGGNHILHTIRRNIGLKIILFNNRIYALTKGQASPTSPLGAKTKTSPYGTIDWPVRPIRLALGLDATFVARSVDSDINHLTYVLDRAAKHKGTAFVEVYQNCVVYTDKEFDYVRNKEQREEFGLKMEHGKPLIFGKDKNKGIRIKNFIPEVVEFKPGHVPDDIIVHNEKSSAEAFILSGFVPPNFPTPLGIFKVVEKLTYEGMLDEQIKSLSKTGSGDLEELLSGPDTWVVKK